MYVGTYVTCLSGTYGMYIHTAAVRIISVSVFTYICTYVSIKLIHMCVCTYVYVYIRTYVYNICLPMVAYRLAPVYIRMLCTHCYVHHYSLSSPLTGPVSVCSEEEENQENHAKPHPTYKIMKW